MSYTGCRSNAAGTGADIYTWTPTLPSAKTYNVYARWRDVSGNTTNAPYTIYHDGGSTTVTISQTSHGIPGPCSALSP